jgi:hypothetical protein
MVESIVQLGYLGGESEGTKPGAGVLGGEKVRPRGASRPTSCPFLMAVNVVVMVLISDGPEGSLGSSMLGMGKSAAATDARNCCVGAES